MGMDRRGVLKQIVVLPVAVGLSACVRGSMPGGVADPPPAPGPAAAVTPVAVTPGLHADDVTSRQKQWPIRSLTSYTTKDAKDLDPMPEKPTLLDFLKHRFLLAQHLFYAADWAMRQGLPEPIALACLLHDCGHNIARPDHGYWAAQLVAPYVSEEVSWAIRSHQALRFYADPKVGYKGPPEFYKEYFGADSKPDPYIDDAYKQALAHKWYGSARLITMADQETPEPKDLYVGDEKHDELDPDKFVDLIGRNFKQPKEGLGYDGSTVAHMWRTIIFPTRML